MKNINKKLISVLRIGVTIVILGALLLPFQNCGGAPESISTSSTGQGTPSSPTPAPSQPASMCPVSTNPAPIGNVSTAAVAVNVGMGPAEGSTPDNQGPTVTINYNSNDGVSRVTQITCNTSNDSGLTINGCNLNNAAATGSITVRVNVADGAECMSGPVTVTVRADDAIFNGNSPDNRCTGRINDNTQISTFTVNRTNTCLPIQRINPSNPSDNAQTGSSVAIDGNRAVVSVPGDDDRGQDAGAAYVYERGAVATNPWVITQKLLPSTASAGSYISAVAISGTTVALGSISSNGGRGTVWVFQHNGSTFIETRVFNGVNIGGNFGYAIAISGNSIAIGAPGENLNSNGQRSGAVYSYTISTGASAGVLTPSGAPMIRGQFGKSVAMSGARLAVGAPFPESATDRLESVYIYDNFSFSRKISHTSGANDYFGYAVALDGTNLLVGAPYTLSRQGRAYLINSSTGANLQTYNLPNGEISNDEIESFGYAVALRGSNVAISAPAKADPNVNVGAIYIFSNLSSAMNRKVRQYAGDRSSDLFGYSIGLSADGWLLSGAPNDDQSGYLNTGATYFVDLP